MKTNIGKHLSFRLF